MYRKQIYFLSDSCTRSTSLARELRTDPRLLGRFDSVYLGYHHNVAKGGSYQHRTSDSVARINAVITFFAVYINLFFRNYKIKKS